MSNTMVEQRAPAGVSRLGEAVAWRWRSIYRPRVLRWLGVPHVQWARVVMDRETERFARALPYASLDAVEISGTGTVWNQFGFRSYRCTSFPEDDVCAAPLASGGAFDVVIAEQVLEHVERPAAAVRNIHDMLRPGGWFIVSTPFLFRVHAFPDDFSRWTEKGLRQLLTDGGFDRESIITGAWGNRACVKANFSRIPSWIPGWHSLHNEPNFPVVVWAFARRS